MNYITIRPFHNDKNIFFSDFYMVLWTVSLEISGTEAALSTIEEVGQELGGN